MTKRDRIMGGLWGSLVGDALGVPVEFQNRATVQAKPVIDMRGHGTYNQPPGTWSDDSSLLLCSTDSLSRHEFDTDDMGRRFLAWSRAEMWTPHGEVFDIGGTTADAISRIARGVRAELAGGDSESSNGNGSLMRIIPVSIRFSGAPTGTFLDRIHRASGITHRHPRAKVACGFYSLVIRELLAGTDAETAFGRAVQAFRAHYEADPSWAVELGFFKILLAGDLARRPESEIGSSGYVIHTLTASLWCLLTTATYEDCALKAVNLGGDTDTTGCVAGGLAGVLYGVDAIPQRWRDALAKKEELAQSFDQFADVVER